MTLQLIEVTMSNTGVDAHELIEALDNVLKGMKRDFMQVSPIISRIMLSDVQGHFSKGMGPEGQWKDLKQSYVDRLGTKNRRSYLYRTGKLLRGIKTNPLKKSARVTVQSDYAKIHNFGGTPELKFNNTMPKREYMYLSKEAQDQIVDLYTSFIKGKWDR